METQFAAAFLIGLLAGMAFKRLRDFTSNRRLRLAAGFGFVGLARAAKLGERILQRLLCLA